MHHHTWFTWFWEWTRVSVMLDNHITHWTTYIPRPLHRINSNVAQSKSSLDLYFMARRWESWSHIWTSFSSVKNHVSFLESLWGLDDIVHANQLVPGAWHVGQTSVTKSFLPAISCFWHYLELQFCAALTSCFIKHSLAFVFSLCCCRHCLLPGVRKRLSWRIT